MEYNALTDFGRRRAAAPSTSTTRWIMVGAIILSVGTAVALIFGKPEFVIGPLVLLMIAIAIFKYPIFGLYLYLLVVYLRPQDLLGLLTSLRPNILLLAATVVSLIIHHRTSNRAHLVLLRNDKMFIAFLVAAALSNITSIWVRSSLETTGELLKVAVFYFAAILLLDRPLRIERYFKYYIGSVAFVSLVQIYTYLTVGLTHSTGKGGYGIIIGGVQVLGGAGPLKTSEIGVNGVGGYSNYFYANASELGIGLCVAYPICYYLFKYFSRRMTKTIFLFLTIMFIASIIITGSRGAFVGLAVTVIYILYKEKKLLVGLVTLAVLSVPLMYIVSERYVQRVESIADYETDESVQIRLSLWRAAVDMLADYPLFGVGTGNFADAYGSTYRAKGSANLYWSPHNIFIQIIAEMGVFGFTIYMLFIAAIFWLNKKSRQLLENIRDGPRLAYLTHGLDVALVGYIVAGQFITATYYPHIFQISLWASALYLIALKTARQAEAENAPPSRDLVRHV